MLGFVVKLLNNSPELLSYLHEFDTRVVIIMSAILSCGRRRKG